MSCGDQTKQSLEVVYPNICSYVETTVNHNWCSDQIFDQVYDVWNQTEIENFKQILLKYTKENIMKITIFIKDPFAVKYKIVQNASL